MPALAEPFPVRVIADLLGVPADKQDRFVEWSDAGIPDAGDMAPEQRAELMAEMQQYLLHLAQSRRGNPTGDDLISVLANVEVDGEVLTDDELVMFLNQLLIAGNETTRNMISGGLWALANNPDQWQRLVEDRSLIPSAVEEFLRWTTPVVAFMRTALVDTELRGVAHPRRRPAAAALRLGQPGRGRRSARTPTGSTSAATPTTTSPSASAPTSASAPPSPAWRAASCWRRCSTAGPGIEPAGDVVRTGSAIIAGVKSAPVRLAG